MRFVEVIGLAARTMFDAEFPVDLYFSRTHRGITYTNCRRELMGVCSTVFVSVEHRFSFCNAFVVQILLI